MTTEPITFPAVDSHLPTRRSLRPAKKRRSILAIILGLVGEILIIAGLLIIGFVVWQVWWQSNQAVAVAQEQVDEFHASIPAPVMQQGTLHTDGEPPRMEPVALGETFGVLIVPNWYEKTNNTMPIRSGTTPEILDQAAAGHYIDTAMPGELGNMALAGHRRTHGNSFRFINDLDVGDQVIIETARTWYIYEVTRHQIVLPNQISVIAPVPDQPGAVPTSRMLTLTTCHSPSLGEWGNSHRWITHAEFVGWMDRSDGMPEQVLNEVEFD